ncbi:MAG: DegT/DnrJ/EryC1/StrS family aminotransferase [Desulfatibacillum sp.]|nr:DegT/DnrJ/EryC1/StrS family aminotransferase [Desulfatibacillum sp.]
MPGFEIFSDEERREVNDVLDTGVLFRYGFDAQRNGHWKAKTFEKEFAERVGVPYAHLCSSGTSALVIALAACGIGAGDEVIIPPFTFVASFESVMAVGAIPVFADIDETLCLDPKAVAKAVTERTKAVVPVHMCGAMAQIDALKQLCDEKGLMLVEDACQSVGATFKGQALGTFGKAGCYSFDAVKTITCGEGGGVVTPHEEIYQKIHQFADHGHDHVGNDRGLEGHPIIGLNFRISELNAAVGLAQLRKLDTILEIQRRNKTRIKEAMTGLPGVSFRHLPDPAGDSATFLSFFLPDEDQARECASQLAKAGVGGCPYWYDNNWHYIRSWDHLKNRVFPARQTLEMVNTAPDYANLSLDQSHKVMGRTISMQIMLGWTQQDVDSRIEKIRQVFGA